MDLAPFDDRLQWARKRVDGPLGGQVRHGWLYECPGGCRGDFWVPDDADDVEHMWSVVVGHLRELHPMVLRQLEAGSASGR